MTTPQFSGPITQAHPLGEQPTNLSGHTQVLTDLSRLSADENNFAALIERFADWVYYQNELEFE